MRAAVDSDAELQIEREQKDAVLQLFSRVNNTDRSLTLPSLRSQRSNELAGIDCGHAFISPLLLSRGKKSICHLQFMVCFIQVPIHE